MGVLAGSLTVMVTLSLIMPVVRFISLTIWRWSVWLSAVMVMSRLCLLSSSLLSRLLVHVRRPEQRPPGGASGQRDDGVELEVDAQSLLLEHLRRLLDVLLGRVRDAEGEGRVLSRHMQLVLAWVG